ncbi:hypothetical protein [Defluviimonas salinarum]|uniref:Restriction endonuclease n=1 Tax=Defluviimonas salinarum TaxID=2992147 RepID=A0ABT3J5Q7_9RHOB|nr:hypothetical protein [Defluviimonas salinarum]MCW3783008.1 hypothetical protein [Defluviimonas salinarum]
MGRREKTGIRSGNRIYEPEIDEIFRQAFLTNPAFCDLFRARLRIEGTGPARSALTQQPHHPDTGTIDLDVVLGETRLLIENKIQAPWSETSEGVAQPERYERSARRCGARSVLVAPSAYIGQVEEAIEFDHCLDYEELAPALAGQDRYFVEEAVRQALIPTMNPNEIVTRFFKRFEALVPEVAPGLHIHRHYIRNDGSYTAHFIARKSLVLHPGLPTPSIFLQFRQANVKLLIQEWGRQVDALRATGLHHGTGYRLEQIRGSAGTLGVVAATPGIDPSGDFEVQRQNCVTAIQTTEALCRWWDAHPEVISAWSRVAETAGRAR